MLNEKIYFRYIDIVSKVLVFSKTKSQALERRYKEKLFYFAANGSFEQLNTYFHENNQPTQLEWVLSELRAYQPENIEKTDILLAREREKDYHTRTHFI